jgi:hypothetical protein
MLREGICVGEQGKFFEKFRRVFDVESPAGSRQMRRFRAKPNLNEIEKTFSPAASLCLFQGQSVPKAFGAHINKTPGKKGNSYDTPKIVNKSPRLAFTARLHLHPPCA